MSFPVLEASSNGEVSSNATSSTISLPSGISAGDLLVVYFSVDGTTSTIAVDTGFSGSNWNIVQYTGGSSNKIAVVWKVAEGSDALRLTHNSEQSTHISDRFSGADTVEVSSGNTGATSNANSFNLDLAGGVAKDVHWISFAGMDGIGSASAAPTNYTNLRNKTATNSTGASSFVAERQLNASGENPLAFTNTAQRWQVVTIAVYQDGALVDVLPGDGAEGEASGASADINVAASVVGAGATANAQGSAGALVSARLVLGAGAAANATGGDAELVYTTAGVDVLAGESALALASGGDAQLVYAPLSQPQEQFSNAGGGGFAPYYPREPRLVRRIRMAGEGARILATGASAQMRAHRILSGEAARMQAIATPARLRRHLVLNADRPIDSRIRHAQAADEAWLLAA